MEKVYDKQIIRQLIEKESTALRRNNSRLILIALENLLEYTDYSIIWFAT